VPLLSSEELDFPECCGDMAGGGLSSRAGGKDDKEQDIVFKEMRLTKKYEKTLRVPSFGRARFIRWILRHRLSSSLLVGRGR
jgi:hypothetical protein